MCIVVKYFYFVCTYVNAAATVVDADACGAANTITTITTSY